ncbi:hypothetical protein [Streptomyces sp. G1]|uniref:hypothetical protein n=1 Tax=Streptomyces sp. G1 TaxID=361572 RepID=UPI00202FA292|nr:hypothetical protein [Streptomyces sp. G1]MCM1975216.1 hypothetical protein [Streptomyces sp. G1]
MQLPAEAVTATALVEVVRLATPPSRPGHPFTGDPVALWPRAEAETAFALIAALPGSTQHRCGFHPGWAVRAYGDDLDLPLYEVQFRFSCHEARLHGPSVTRCPDQQFFDPESSQGRELLARFRATDPCAQARAPLPSAMER